MATLLEQKRLNKPRTRLVPQTRLPVKYQGPQVPQTTPVALHVNRATVTPQPRGLVRYHGAPVSRSTVTVNPANVPGRKLLSAGARRMPPVPPKEAVVDWDRIRRVNNRAPEPSPKFVNDTTTSQKMKGPVRRTAGRLGGIARGAMNSAAAAKGGALGGIATLGNVAGEAAHFAGDPNYSLGDAGLNFSRKQLNGVGSVADLMTMGGAGALAGGVRSLLSGNPYESMNLSRMGDDYVNAATGISPGVEKPNQVVKQTTPNPRTVTARSNGPTSHSAVPRLAPKPLPEGVVLQNRPKSRLSDQEQNYIDAAAQGDAGIAKRPDTIRGSVMVDGPKGRMGQISFRKPGEEVLPKTRLSPQARTANAIAKAADDVAHGRGTPSHGRALLLKQIGDVGSSSDGSNLDTSMKRSRLRGQELTNQKALADMMKVDPKRFKTEVVTDIEGNPSIITIDQQTGEVSIRLPDGSVQTFSGREEKGKDQVMVDDAGNFSFRGLSISKDEARKRMGE